MRPPARPARATGPTDALSNGRTDGNEPTDGVCARVRDGTKRTPAGGSFVHPPVAGHARSVRACVAGQVRLSLFDQSRRLSFRRFMNHARAQQSRDRLDRPTTGSSPSVGPSVATVESEHSTDALRSDLVDRPSVRSAGRRDLDRPHGRPACLRA